MKDISEKVICPLTGDFSAEVFKRHNSVKIIEYYKENLSVDVERFFLEKEFDEYKCFNTGFRFYHPQSLGGDAKYYADMERFDWYYPESKWEYDFVLEKIDSGSSVLEIGSGEGFFLKKLKSKNIEAVGLELNHEAAKIANNNGLSVEVLPIQDYVVQNNSKFDVVCSFQVMEHIYEIKDVLEASVKALKKAGNLIICVPNNDSFIKNDEANILNLPPHHTCLWTKESLRGLTKIFPLEIVDLKEEPLQKCHLEWYSRLLRERSIDKIPFLRGAFYRLGGVNILNWLLSKFSNRITGMSVIATFKKK